MKRGPVADFSSSFLEKSCKSCPDWKFDGSYYVLIKPNGKLTFVLEVKLTAPIDIRKERTWLTWMIASD